MSGLLNVSSSPHVRSKDTTEKIMRYVFIALMPASIFGIYNFGINALIVIAVTVAASVLTEYLYEKAMHKPNTISDWSAAVTGLLLALNLPCPYGTENVIRMCLLGILGSVFAIIIVKQLFGGLGQNFMNPALGARCFLLISFTGRMTSFTYDGITGATPLALLKAGESVNVLDMVIGRIPGTIGETSVIAIVIGAIFLIWMDVIDLRIPGTYIVTFAIFALLFGGHGFDLNYVCAELAGGGLMLGAFFMATDYVTSPITKKGQIVYGIILGCLTGLFRIFGGSAEGVSYADHLLQPSCSADRETDHSESIR